MSRQIVTKDGVLIIPGGEPILDLPAITDRLLFPEVEHPVAIEVADDERYCIECERLASRSPSFIEGYKVQVAVDCGNHTWRLRKHDNWLAAGRTQISLLLTAIGFNVGFFTGDFDVYQAEDGSITGFNFPAKGLTYHQLDRIAALFGTKKINWTKRTNDYFDEGITVGYDHVGAVEVLDPVLAAVG